MVPSLLISSGVRLVEEQWNYMKRYDMKRYDMKRYDAMSTIPGFVARLGLACMVLCVVGCAAPSTAQSSQHTPQATPTPTALPTATPRPKPTKAPAVTLAFCQQMLSVARANQVTNPPTAATSIRVQSSPKGGSCNYEYSLLHGTISIFIVAYPGGSLSDLANQALKGAVINGKVTTEEPVSGLGDQAYYGAVTGSLSFSGITIRQKQQSLYVLDGSVIIMVNAASVNGAGGIGNVSDAQALDEFKQIAALVLAQL